MQRIHIILTLSLVILASFLLEYDAFTIGIMSHYRLNRRIVAMSGGQGFGKKKAVPSTPVVIDKSSQVEEMQTMSTSTSTPVDTSSSTGIEQPVIENDPEKAILNTKMFKNIKKRQEDDIEQKIQELREQEELIAEDPSVGAVPQIVADRMITRIAGFFGVPVFGGLAIFVGAFFASKNYDFTIPPNIIAYATQVPFVLGLVGISYAILSSSWDDEPGSFWGINEFKINFKRIQEGFEREKRNAKLKEEIEKNQGKYK